jgi:hypothetical protein
VLLVKILTKNTKSFRDNKLDNNFSQSGRTVKNVKLQ